PGADEPVHGIGAAEVEARIRADACVLDLAVGHAIVFGAVEPAARQLDADQRHGTSLPAIAGVDRQRGLIDVLVHPALATLHAEEETAAVCFVARGHRLLRNVRRWLHGRGWWRRHRLRPGIGLRLLRYLRHALGRIRLFVLPWLPALD